MIAIIDYQMGNLRSVQKGFEKVGHSAVVTSDPGELMLADKVVLPGVGAFEDAMAELRWRELVEPIVAMGRLLDLEVVAEGVENDIQLGLIREFGCHCYQGYYASPAVDAAAFAAMLSNFEMAQTTA